MGLISVYQQYGSYFRSVDQRIITAKASVRAELWRGKELMQGTHHPVTRECRQWGQVKLRGTKRVRGDDVY